MRFLRPHKFRASPLSLAVPLEGSDTVVGLRELQRRSDGYNLAKALKLDALEGPKKQRSWRKRYRGPFLTDLTAEDLLAEPCVWQSFLFGHRWHTYNVPEDLNHYCERTEENLMTYLPNYLRVVLMLMMMAMVLRPWSILGALSVAGLIAFKLTLAATPELRAQPLQQRFWLWLQSQFTQAQAAMRQEQVRNPAGVQHMAAGSAHSIANADTVQAMLQLLCYVAVIYCNTLGALARAVLWSFMLIATHASLRRTPQEYVEALKDPQIANSRGAAAVTDHPRVAGVAFAEVLGLRQWVGSKDPHKVFKETWQLAASICSAAGAYSWHTLQFYSNRLWMRIRGPLPSFLHA